MRVRRSNSNSKRLDLFLARYPSPVYLVLKRPALGKASAEISARYPEKRVGFGLITGAMSSKSRAKRDKFTATQFLAEKPKAKRRAKRKDEAKIPGRPAGDFQEANGPFQDQEITAEQPSDQPRSRNSASKAVTSSSEDSETDTVDVVSE